jgi:uncharacterized protein YeaO (DUF488 family)
MVYRCLQFVGEDRMIRTKSVYSPIDRQRDGLRILATRMRGRGLKKSRYHAWMANLGPSERLLSLHRAGKMSWADFGRRYRRELLGSSAAFDRSNKGIKNHGQKFTLRLIQQLGRRGDVTLMCHCGEEEMLCHRRVLAKMLAGKIG